MSRISLVSDKSSSPAQFDTTGVANGQVMVFNSGTGLWTPANAMSNPMTTSQDVIVAGSAGAPGRLGVGSNGQVLTVNGSGQVVWATPAGGMSNPMTTSQDLIVGGSSGTPARLPVGANNATLGVVSGAIQWVLPAIKPTLQLVPSGDTTGAQDDINFNAACGVLAAIPEGGEIQIVGSDNTPFYTKNSALTYTSGGWAPLAQQPSTGNVGAPMSIQGIGRPRLCPVGAAKTGIYYHRTDTYGNVAQTPDWAQRPPGYIKNVIIDGIHATGASIGIDVGDGYGHNVDVWCVNFIASGNLSAGTTSGQAYGTTGTSNTAIGALICNRSFWTEKGEFRIHTSNCDTAVVIEKISGATSTSFEYNEIDVTLFGYPNQNGVVLQGNAQCNGCFLKIRGNMSTNVSVSGNPTNNAAALAVIGSASKEWGSIEAKVENNFSPPSGFVNSYSIYGDGTGTIHDETGHIFMSSLSSGSSFGGAEHSFSGPTDTNTFQSWPASGAFPVILNGQQKTTNASTSVWTNLGPPAQVIIVGGTTTTNVFLNGQNINTTTKPIFLFVDSSGTFEVDWTGAASNATWILARQQ